MAGRGTWYTPGEWPRGPEVMGMSVGDGLTSRRYRKLRKAFRAECEALNKPCWLCQQAIDYRIEWPDEEAWELDHLYPRSTHPELAEDPANFRPSHRLCNLRRGNKMPQPGLGSVKRRWIK